MFAGAWAEVDFILDEAAGDGYSWGNLTVGLSTRRMAADAMEAALIYHVNLLPAVETFFTLAERETES